MSELHDGLKLVAEHTIMPTAERQRLDAMLAKPAKERSPRKETSKRRAAS